MAARAGGGIEAMWGRRLCRVGARVRLYWTRGRSDAQAWAALSPQVRLDKGSPFVCNPREKFDE